MGAMSPVQTTMLSVDRTAEEEQRMAFILAADGRDADVGGAFHRYQKYLQSLRDVFPPSAYALATSDWYFNFKDHRCPHDVWLETFGLSEASSANGGKQRSLSVNVRLWCLSRWMH